MPEATATRSFSFQRYIAFYAFAGFFSMAGFVISLDKNKNSI